MATVKTTREEKLVEKLGVPLQALRDYRTLHLDEEEHYLLRPLRYTPEGVKRVTAYFLAPVLTPPVADSSALEVPAVSIQPPPPPDAPRARLSPLKAAWAGEIPEGHARPVVHTFPLNNRLVLCKVGEHRNVRVLVGDARSYVKNQEIPVDVELSSFDPKSLITYRGRKPRRKGCW